MMRISTLIFSLLILCGSLVAQTPDISSSDIQAFGIKRVQIETYQVSRSGSVLYLDDQFQFDWNGRVVKRQKRDHLHHLGTEAEFRYDRDGNKVYQAIQLDHSSTREQMQWECTYEEGLLVFEENPNSALSRKRFYDAGERLIRMETWFDKDTKISEERYFYDGADRLVREIHEMDFIYSLHTYQYDDRGNKIAARQETQYFAESKAPKFVHETYAYNDFNQRILRQRKDREGRTLNETVYQYDKGGRLVKETTGTQVVVYERNERGLVVQETGYKGPHRQYVKAYLYSYWSGEALSMRTRP